MKRIPMFLQLTEQPPTQCHANRQVRDSDARELAILLYAAFRATIDDEGDSFADATREIEKTFAGQYGRLLSDCSFVIEGKDALLSACLISWYEPSACPLVVFTMTHPLFKRQGMARCLLTRSIHALAQRGYSRLELIVTKGNTPAESLYTSLGFLPI